VLFTINTLALSSGRDASVELYVIYSQVVVVKFAPALAVAYVSDTAQLLASSSGQSVDVLILASLSLSRNAS
jgi:hypothetical protein